MDATLRFHARRDQWRAQVGRMPRGHESRFRNICERFPEARVVRAIEETGRSGLRRTAERWSLFLAFFGEAP